MVTPHLLFINLLHTCFTNYLSDDKNLNEIYNKYIEQIIDYYLHEYKCPYCGCYGFRKHGFYERTYFYYGSVVLIDIRRIICLNEKCKRTKGVLPPFLTPYKRYLLKHRIDIIKARINKDKEKLEQLLSEYGIDEKYLERTMGCFYRHAIKKEKSSFINNFNESQAYEYHKNNINNQSFLQDSTFYPNMCL